MRVAALVEPWVILFAFIGAWWFLTWYQIGGKKKLLRWKDFWWSK